MGYDLLLQAIERSLYEFIKDTKGLSRYQHKRAAYVATGVVATLERLFPGRVYGSAYQNPHSRNEHDAVVVTEDGALIVEAKAVSLRPPFRNPEKALERLRRDFEPVQDGLQQIADFHAYVMGQPEAILFNKRGHELVRFPRPRRIRSICVASSPLGSLTTNAGTLFPESAASMLPWIVSYDDFEETVDILLQMGKSAQDFLSLVDTRVRLHNSAFAHDELEIVSAILLRPDLVQEAIDENALLSFSPEATDEIDRMYLERTGRAHLAQRPPGILGRHDFDESYARMQQMKRKLP